MELSFLLNADRRDTAAWKLLGKVEQSSHQECRLDKLLTVTRNSMPHPAKLDHKIILNPNAPIQI